MTTLKQLKCIGKRYKFGVFGYIRLKGKELSLPNIPQMIHYVCLQFYFHGEYFDKCDCNAEISNDKTIAFASTSISHFNDLIYGKLWIDSLSNYIATWTFKLRKLHTRFSGKGIRIYLTTSDILKTEQFTARYYYFYNNGECFAMPHTRYYEGLNASKPPKFTEGDIIELTLDTKNVVIKLQRNDNNPATIFTSIDKGKEIKYKFAICLQEKDNVIELIDFDCTK